MLNVRIRKIRRVNKEFLLGGLVVLLDQVSKVVFVSEYINIGGVFGIGKDWAWMLFSLMALVVLGWVLAKSERVMERYGLVIILASGLSNLIDRVVLGGARDFIFWPILNVYGNVSDLLLTIGVIVVCVEYLVLSKGSKVK